MSVARAMWLQPPDSFLEERRRRGLDKRDEMWDGILHMVLPPSREHNRRQHRMHRFLEDVIEACELGTVDVGSGVRPPGSGMDNYRVPNLSVVAASRSNVLSDWIEGGPDLVVEVRSPGDETYDKLPFYAALGVHEVLVVDRDSGRPELYRLAGREYVAVAMDGDGWLASDRFPVAVRTTELGLEGQDRSRADRPTRSLNP